MLLKYLSKDFLVHKHREVLYKDSTIANVLLEARACVEHMIERHSPSNMVLGAIKLEQRGTLDGLLQVTMALFLTFNIVLKEKFFNAVKSQKSIKVNIALFP